jgi:hypothetical protein
MTVGYFMRLESILQSILHGLKECARISDKQVTGYEAVSSLLESLAIIIGVQHLMMLSSMRRRNDCHCNKMSRYQKDGERTSMSTGKWSMLAPVASMT